MKAWMFHSWVEDFFDEHKLLENQGYLIGSFINPEAVRKILGTDTEKFVSSDKEFEELSKRIREGELDSAAQQNQKKKRKRKLKLKG